MTNRILKLRNQLERNPQICIESFKIISNTYKNMVGEPFVKQRAEAMYNLYTQFPIYIKDGDLLCGNGASKPNALEVDIGFGKWDKSEIDALREDGYSFDPADEPVLYALNKEIPPYSLQDGIGEVVKESTIISVINII